MGWRRGEGQCPGHYENAPPPAPPRHVQPATPFPLPLLKRAPESQTLAEIIVLSDPGGIQKFLKPEKVLGDHGPTLILQTRPLRPREDTCSRPHHGN